MAGWSLLPSNLVNDVAALLSAADQARMASTCKSWRQATAYGFRRTPQKPSIWVLLADRVNQGNFSNRCEFQSFSEDLKRRYFFSMPRADVRLLGSSRGWLMLVDRSTRLHAFNPITKATLSFPVCGSPRTRMFGHVTKAIFVWRKDLPIVVAIMRRVPNDTHSTEVAVAKHGDDAWTPLLSPLSVADIAAHEGKLYAINQGIQIRVYDFCEKKPTSFFPTVRIRVPRRFSSLCQNYLGFVSGELALVRWWNDIHCTVRGHRYLSTEVLMLDSTRSQNWVTVHDLNGNAILIGNDGVLTLPAGEFEELKANCVYALSRQEPSSKGCLTVFNLGTSQVSFQHLPIAYSLLPFWFLPNPDDI